MDFKPRKETPEETAARQALLYAKLVEADMEPERAERAMTNAKPTFDSEMGRDVWPQRLARKPTKKGRL